MMHENKKKRILIFSLTYHPYVGGAEIAIKEITDRISADDYEFEMITLRFDRNLPEVERVGNVTVHRIGFTAVNAKISDRKLPFQCRIAKLLFPFTSFSKAVSLHKKNVYDMIWAMMANQAGFGALLFKYAYPQVPYFLELQDGNSLKQIKARQPFLRLIWAFYRQIYLKADIIKAISHFIADLAREVGFKGRVEVIPNAVDVAKFSAPVSIEEQAELKARFGKKMDDVFLFTASRLVLSRGVEDVIRALPHLPTNVKFLIAGIGEDQRNLKKIARDSGVAKRVFFVGHVSYDRLPVYYQISDIFVRPSIVEGFGNAFVEAFAAGIPVIATQVGGIPDFLSDPERNPRSPATGLFCEVRNPESIARAVLRYMQEPALVAEIVQNAKALAEKKYDWDIIARDMQKEILSPLTNV